jgi:hypothetical protein
MLKWLDRWILDGDDDKKKKKSEEFLTEMKIFYPFIYFKS